MKTYSIGFALSISLLLVISGLRLAPAAQTIKTIYETQKLLDPDGGSGGAFGDAVAISGNTAIVGNFTDGSFAGSASIFAFDGTSWNFQAKLTPTPGAGGQFGLAVAISGNTAIVGAPFDSTLGLDAGAVYVFTFDGTTWTQQAKLYSGDPTASSLFGNSVALSGDTAIIGSFLSHPGAAYVFNFDGTAWSQQAKLTASDGTTDDHFGSSVSRSGNRALVGAYQGAVGGAAYIFGFDGANWSQEAELTGLDTHDGDGFGTAVSLSGDLALVGAPDRGESRGAAYIFAYDGVSWSQQTKLRVAGGMKYDSFGYSVALSDTVAIVGAQHFLDPGVVYQYSLRRGKWNLRAQFLASDGHNGNTLGASVAFSGNTLLGGADDTYYAPGNGAAYTFKLTR